MKEVIGIKQHLTNQISYIQTSRQFEIGDFVVVDNNKGEYIYECVRFNEPFNKYAHNIMQTKSIRIATSDEIEKYSKNQAIAQKLSEIFLEMARKLEVNVLLVGIEISLCARHARYTYYSAESLQFAQMIKYLLANNPKRFKIEFYQVGEREYYAIGGGIGVCGYEMCCHSRSHKPPVITTNLLKELNINLSQKMMLSGVCGKYKCCLLFDSAQTEDYKNNIPDVHQEFEYEGEVLRVKDIDFTRAIVIAKGHDTVHIKFDYFLRSKNDCC